MFFSKKSYFGKKLFPHPCLTVSCELSSVLVGSLNRTEEVPRARGRGGGHPGAGEGAPHGVLGAEVHCAGAGHRLHAQRAPHHRPHAASGPATVRHQRCTHPQPINYTFTFEPFASSLLEVDSQIT